MCEIGWRMAGQAGLCFVGAEIKAEVIRGDECEGAGCEGDKRGKLKQRKALLQGMLRKGRDQCPKGYVEEAGAKVEKKAARTVLQNQGKKTYRTGINDQH